MQSTDSPVLSLCPFVSTRNSVNIKFFGVVMVDQGHIFYNDGLSINECFLYLIPMSRYFLGFLGSRYFVMTSLCNEGGECDNILLCLAQRHLLHWTIPRNLWLGGVSVRTLCAFFGCGFIPLVVNTHPRYSVPLIQNLERTSLCVCSRDPGLPLCCIEHYPSMFTQTQGRSLALTLLPEKVK
jgi:hypothetical protein